MGRRWAKIFTEVGNKKALRRQIRAGEIDPENLAQAKLDAGLISRSEFNKETYGKAAPTVGDPQQSAASGRRYVNTDVEGQTKKIFESQSLDAYDPDSLEAGEIRERVKEDLTFPRLAKMKRENLELQNRIYDEKKRQREAAANQFRGAINKSLSTPTGSSLYSTGTDGEVVIDAGQRSKAVEYGKQSLGLDEDDIDSILEEGRGAYSSGYDPSKPLFPDAAYDPKFRRKP